MTLLEDDLRTALRAEAQALRVPERPELDRDVVEPGRRPGPRWLVAAACLALIVAGVVAVAQRRGDPQPPPLVGSVVPDTTLPAPSVTSVVPDTTVPTTTVAPHDTLPPQTSATALPRNGSIEPGTYTLAKPPAGAASDYRRLILTLPAGWAITDGLVHKHLDQVDEMAFSVWTGVHDVYDNPCNWQESPLSAPELDADPLHRDFDNAATGSTIGKPLHGGLANQIGRNASKLTKVELGGQAALKIELSVPAELDLTTCDQGKFQSWIGSSVTGGANDHHRPGQIDVVYMVDVDRSALVIDVSHMPATSESDLAELEAILASMIVVR